MSTYYISKVRSLCARRLLLERRQNVFKETKTSPDAHRALTLDNSDLLENLQTHCISLEFKCLVYEI